MASLQMKLDQPQNPNFGTSTSSSNEPTSFNANGLIKDNNNGLDSNLINCTSHNRCILPEASGSSEFTNGSNHRTFKEVSDCNNNNTDKEATNNPGQMAVDMPMRRLKKVGWYYGSISPNYAAQLLEDEQDGSFLVRDSSSECYIFSMTFKLEGQIHHSRIEHCKGHFSFGRSPKFFCTTIVDFIEQAIEFSHNGNMLFFLHRSPSMEGPVRFKMIPLSRFKGISSLKHLCRFAILPYVRRDKISELSIPQCLREYLHEPFQT